MSAQDFDVYVYTGPTRTAWKAMRGGYWRNEGGLKAFAFYGTEESRKACTYTVMRDGESLGKGEIPYLLGTDLNMALRFVDRMVKACSAASGE